MLFFLCWTDTVKNRRISIQFPMRCTNISIFFFFSLFLQCYDRIIQVTGTGIAKGSKGVCNINLNWILMKSMVISPWLQWLWIRSWGAALQTNVGASVFVNPTWYLSACLDSWVVVNFCTIRYLYVSAKVRCICYCSLCYTLSKLLGIITTLLKVITRSH